MYFSSFIEQHPGVEQALIACHVSLPASGSHPDFISPTLTISHPHRFDTATPLLLLQECTSSLPWALHLHLLVRAQVGSEQKQQDSLKAEEGNCATYKRVFALPFDG